VLRLLRNAAHGKCQETPGNDPSADHLTSCGSSDYRQGLDL
jgi:hypothetical protein